jgi:hypothetical protein
MACLRDRKVHRMTRKIKAPLFDVFGTVVDWRSGVIRDVTEIAKAKGAEVDAAAFADDVGQLPGDPDSLPGAGAPGLLAFALRGPLDNTLHIGAACPDVLGCQPADGCQRQRRTRDPLADPGG